MLIYLGTAQHRPVPGFAAPVMVYGTAAPAFAAAATFASIGPALSHTIVGNRVFPATLAIDDPGVNDELALPSFAYVANPDNSNQFDYGFEWQKTITYNLSFSIVSRLTHLVNTVRPDGSIGGVTGWQNIETQVKWTPYQNAEHEFIVSVAGNPNGVIPAMQAWARNLSRQSRRKDSSARVLGTWMSIG